MSVNIQVWGHSDDCIELRGDISEEFNLPSGHNDWIAIIKAPTGEEAILYVDYRNNGTWTVSLGRIEEDAVFPTDWFSGLTTDDESTNGYTIIAQLNLPDGSIITTENQDLQL